MKTVDVYSRYYEAAAEFGGVKRRGAIVKLTVESDEGNITYTAGVSFFPHVTDDDFAVSYDAFLSETVFRGRGRRSKKREAALLYDLRPVIDRLSESHGATVIWDAPMGEARLG